MPTSELTATFFWDLLLDGSVERFDEERLRNQLERYRTAIFSADNVMGALSISGNSADLLLEDELWHLMAVLCFSFPPKLVDGTSVVFHYLSWYGELRLTVEGAIVDISGDGVSSAKVPLNGLVRALVTCGQRYLNLIERLRDDDTCRAIWEDLTAVAPAASEAMEHVNRLKMV